MALVGSCATRRSGLIPREVLQNGYTATDSPRFPLPQPSQKDMRHKTSVGRDAAFVAHGLSDLYFCGSSPSGRRERLRRLVGIGDRVIQGGRRSMTDIETQYFLYQFEAVRPEMVTDPTAWTAEDHHLAEQHYEYLKRATAKGTVLLAGRSLDGVGPAIGILEARSEKEARRFMESDPFVSGGLMRARLHPFRAALMRGAG